MNTTARYFSILGSKYRNLIIDYKQSNFNLKSILATWLKINELSSLLTLSIKIKIYGCT